MSEPSAGNRSVTRGQFLTTGTAAAAAASVGALSLDAHETHGATPQPAPCWAAKSCPPRDQTWSITAGILNSFWSDIFPRVVAEYWHQRFVEPTNPNIRMDDWDATAFAGATQATPVASPPTSWNLTHRPGVSSDPVDGAWKGTPTFQDRRALVNAYLAQENGVIPIRVMGEGEFDFILSDQGLDLFLPPMPLDQADLLRYYTFRGTGRRAIGIPGFLQQGVSAMSTDSPTGPSQAVMQLPQVQLVVNDVLEINPDLRPCATEVIQCLRNHRQPLDDRRVRVPVVRMSLEEYQCLMSALRCWQVSGSVYRGILTELPRVVAAIWMERLNETDGVASAYAVAFNQPGNEGLRKIFRERLETALPGGFEMRFETLTDLQDVLITNQGFFFPPVGATPGETDVYREIRRGRAGNPVFTDSIRCA